MKQLNVHHGLRGTSALMVSAVQGITDIVEGMHGAIVNLTPVLSRKSARPSKTRGITRLVYGSVRGITSLVGWGIDRGLEVVQLPAVNNAIAPVLNQLSATRRLESVEPYRETVSAAINGVLGDTLAATNNPLAIRMQLRQSGKSVEALTSANSKLLILVHGLCMNDLQWQRQGHDHGAMLSEQLAYEAIYLHYNTGRTIDENGADFSALLEHTLASWPVEISELVMVCHSMGGLVARSACHHALQSEHRWVKHLGKLVTLGTPHAGAPLERAGRGVDFVLGISPYSAPLARLGLIRSAGIQDLRDGSVTADGVAPAWPQHVKLYTLAATGERPPSKLSRVDLAQPLKKLLGDGLVPVTSALVQEGYAKLGLPRPLPAKRQAVVYETDHFEILNSQAVAQHLIDWLQAKSRSSAHF